MIFGPKNRKVKFRSLLMFQHYRSDDKLCIYFLTNKLTNKSYVGQCPDTIHRLRVHRDKGPFSSLLTSEGFESDNFVFTVLETDICADTIDDRERHYIAELNTLEPHGYNRTTGGKRNFVYSDERIQEIKGSVLPHLE